MSAEVVRLRHDRLVLNTSDGVWCISYFLVPRCLLQQALPGGLLKRELSSLDIVLGGV